MKKTTILIHILIFVSYLTAFSQQTTKDGSRKAIICLTYDDGLETQLSTAVPQLNSFNLKATFFLNSIHGSSQSNKIGQTPESVLAWTNVALQGHELANHTLFHPCPENLGWNKTLAIDNYTIDQIIKEIEINNGMLSLLDPKRKSRSFAFPCNNILVEGKDYSKIIKEKGLITYARAGGDENSIITNFQSLNTMQVPSWHVFTNTTLEQLIAFAEKARQTNGMGVYQIHGVGGQVFEISSEAHKAFLQYLKNHEDEYWVTTFSEAMNYIAKKNSP
jgi:peptidoglycan/xylan/chitin deacetylase (PgdA/CDA1 family)